jgi:succinoglycan biosynthesis protein ExoO
MNPEVSVIIPAYNTEAYIVQAIQSALRQTEENLEVIVVDDASTDATVELAKSFLDKRLKVLVNEQNLGQNGALNRGLKEAKGKWVALLDADDWYAPERLEKLLQVAYTEDADLIADDVYFIRDGDKLPWSTLLHESGKQIDKIRHIDPIFFIENDLPGIGGLPLGLTKPLFKRDFLVQHGIKHDEGIKASQDFWFDLKCLAHGARFVFVPQPYYFYRSRRGSVVTGSKVKRIEQYCSVTQYFLEQEYIKKNPELVHALSKRLTLIEKTKPYYRVVDPFKQGKWLSALIKMVHNPYFFVHFSTQFPTILSRRLRYYFLKNKMINLSFPMQEEM